MRFKITPQSTREDCGSACVCMILNNYFQKNVSLCEIRPIIKNTLNGTSFGDIKKGLERFGINSKIFKAKKVVNAFTEISLPIITQIQNDKDTYHYIVIYKCTNKHLFYADPEFSTVKKIKIKNFILNWIPYIVQVDIETSSLKVDVEDNLNKLGYLNLLSKIKGKVTIIVLLSIVIYALGVILATMFNSYFNIVIPLKLSSLIFYVMVLYIGVSLIKFILNFLTTIMTNSLNKVLDTILSNEFFSSLFHKSPAALEYFGIGEIITTLSNIILIRQRFFICIIALPLNCIWLVTSLILLIRINSNLSMLVFFLIFLLVLIIAHSNDRYQLLSRQVLTSNKTFNDSMIDIFSNVTMIKEYQQELEFTNRGRSSLLENINSKNRLLNFDAKLTGIKQMVLEVFNIVLFSIGTLLIIDNHFTIGSLLTFNSLIGYALNPLLNLANIQSLLTQGKAAQELLFNFLNSNLSLFGNKDFPDTSHNLILEIKDLNFSFESRNPLIKNINLYSEKDNSIAIVGANGSGKTTVGKLLAQYYHPDSGSIKINNLNINQISEKEFYKYVLFIDSNEELISSNIIDNITLGRNINPQVLDEVAKSLNLNNFIDKLDKGYSTTVGKEGINLSLGQKQLIKIARATVEEKSIYIFDEITNGLDNVYKKDTMEYLLQLSGLKIFITHDKELINLCDNILIID